MQRYGRRRRREVAWFGVWLLSWRSQDRCAWWRSQPEFALARDGTLTEIAAVLAGHANLGTIVDEFGQGLLAYAATGNPDPEVLRFVVARGLDVNQPTPAR